MRVVHVEAGPFCTYVYQRLNHTFNHQKSIITLQRLRYITYHTCSRCGTIKILHRPKAVDVEHD